MWVLSEYTCQQNSHHLEMAQIFEQLDQNKDGNLDTIELISAFSPSPINIGSVDGVQNIDMN